MKARLPYIAGFLLLTAVEVCIGIFEFSVFVRSYLGDVIIVWVLYCLWRSFSPKRGSSYLIAGGILVFSFIVEFLQKAHIADILGVENRLLRIIIGTSFATKDLWCYVAGTAVTVAEIWLFRLIRNKKAS